MEIKNAPKYRPNFCGYDARKLKGLLMNTNYDGIADEMRKIGELENFKVFLVKRDNNGVQIQTDKFEKSPSGNGAWAQDYWGFLKNSLLSYENSDKTTAVRKYFNLNPNMEQHELRKKFNYYFQGDIVNELLSLPIIPRGSSRGVAFPIDGQMKFLPEEIFTQLMDNEIKKLDKICKRTHIKGGNYYITQGKNGQTELLIGADELKKLDIEGIKKMFGVEKVHIIPQSDYHLDLFIRPLTDKKVLVADDQMMKKTLADGCETIKNKIISSPQSERLKYKDPFVKMHIFAEKFYDILNRDLKYAPTEEVVKALEKAGYEPIRVPGRMFDLYEGSSERPILSNYLNYLNAHVHINDKGEKIYITNKSNLDNKIGLTGEMKKDLGFSFEDSFLSAVKPHVDRVYFVSGKTNELSDKLMYEYGGGIHCMGSEII